MKEAIKEAGKHLFSLLGMFSIFFLLFFTVYGCIRVFEIYELNECLDNDNHTIQYFNLYDNKVNCCVNEITKINGVYVEVNKCYGGVLE